MVCKHIAHFGNSETFPRSYDSKLWAQYLQFNTTTFMFIDLSKTVFFFLSSLTVHLPAYCHSISVCLVITWEICVPVSTVLLIRFRLGIAGSLAMKGRIWGMWPMQVSLDAVLLKKNKKNTAYSEGGDAMHRMCADWLKDLLEQTMDWQQSSPWRGKSVKRIKGQK